LASILTLTDSNGKLTDPTHIVGGPVAGTVGAMGGNHPISIPYAGQTGYNGLNSAVPTALLNGATGGYWGVATSGCVSPSGVCTLAPNAGTTNGSAINLIPNAAGGTTNLGIECTSCHEPHNQYGFPYFTRVDVTQASGLCQSCHNK
jgi:predicted CXXCH cytochrome family protein